MAEERTSPYQEGGFQLQRINDLQVKINFVNSRLDQRDEISGKFFYEEKVDLLNTLFSEVASRCSEDENKKFYRYKKAIEISLMSRPPFSLRNKVVGLMTIRKAEHFDNVAFVSLKNILYDFEIFVKGLIDKYFRSVGEGGIPLEY